MSTMCHSGRFVARMPTRSPCTRPQSRKAVATLRVNKAQFGTAVWLNGRKVGEYAGCFSAGLFERLLEEEYDKLLAARDRDVHDDSKTTTLPIARAIVKAYVASRTKAPWYIDLLNLNLDEYDLAVARQRIAEFLELFEKDGTRITGNLDFTPHAAT